MEDVVLVCGDHEGFGGDTELLGEEACEDIAEVPWVDVGISKAVNRIFVYPMA